LGEVNRQVPRRVFISSTVQDLAAHRRAVQESVLQLGATVVAMEFFGARDERPKDECLRLVREETDVFVGIYAHRYGFIPDGDDISITEQEYLEALVARHPSFVYRVDKTYRWPKAQVEDGPGGAKLQAFLSRLADDRIYGKFTTPDSLAAEVAADLGRLFAGDATKAFVRTGLFHRPPVGWTSKAGETAETYKLVVFDLDGTLIRGNAFQFSWEAIWSELNISPRIQAEIKREYRRRAADAATAEERIDAYDDWCQAAVKMYREHHLTRDQVRGITSSMHLTKNCRKAMAALRKAGVAIAIVSGGVNTFLEDVFPDFREYVDFVYINELTFDDSGVIDGVISTAYDFQGKAEALEELCIRIACSSAEAVFVGDRFNDEPVLLRAGRGIAYPPNDDQARDAAEVVVRDDDLMKVLPHILDG